jgi:hypothetical protein
MNQRRRRLDCHGPSRWEDACRDTYGGKYDDDREGSAHIVRRDADQLRSQDPMNGNRGDGPDDRRRR